ncbi:MAG TPA: MFS transporter [Patescibacteria group bacterium]|nr:MFS transporter [Patescibacteria group bacterium]
MRRNITLFKIIFPVYCLWFWLGIWMLYYLRFTSFEGVAVIELVQLISRFGLEIPTGAISDIFGKKSTLTLSLFTIAIGNVLMGLSSNFNLIVLSAFICSIGYTLLSGNSDALMYETLKSLSLEHTYDTLSAKILKWELIANGIASIVGGFLYHFSPSLPFFLTAGVIAIAGVLSLWVEEPLVESEHFSLPVYLRYMKSGFSELFASKLLKRDVLLFLLASSFIFMTVEVFDASLALNFHYDERQMGILFAVVTLVAAFGTHMYPQIKKRFSTRSVFFFSTFFMYISALLSGFYGMLAGGISIVGRNLLDSYIDIPISERINRAVESKYRASALSTFSMLKAAPYVVLAIFIGKYMDQTSPVQVVAIIAGSYLYLTLFFIVGIRIKQKLRARASSRSSSGSTSLSV